MQKIQEMKSIIEYFSNMGVKQVLGGIIILIGVLTLIGVLLNLCCRKKISNRWLASKKVFPQILGAAIDIKWKWFGFLMILLVAVAGISLIVSPGDWWGCLKIGLLSFASWLVFKICYTLTDIFSLRKEEGRVTWCQVFILLAIGFWIIGFLIIYDTSKNPKIAAAMGVIGALLGWIFQDKVKGVATFFHLRLHHLLNIGDWIKVPSLNVDGEVKRVSLTTVTIYNWDTTTSTIPINVLHEGHFQNFQNMVEGKTYGRRMLMSFTLDTGWFHSMNEKDFELLQKHDVKDFLPDEEMKEGVLNARLYRLYLYHWMMGHSHVSQQPRLVIRWMEQTEGGMPLQVYAFIIDSGLASFEWQQSQIVEHIIESMDWFGLRLYQSPSAYDVSNSSIYMTDKPATYRKEEL